MENRRSRESFTKSLKRICQRIDVQNVFDVEYRYDFLPGLQHSRLRVRAIWVVGSYARGALRCGDLDLVVEIVVEEGGLPLTSTISRSVIGRAPDVRLYIGNPEENTSRVEFREAALVWSSDALDWNAAIDAILPDPEATRFERPHDRLPLRKEQIAEYGDKDLFEEIVDLLEQGVLASEWFPLTDIVVELENWPYEATDFFESIQRWCGKKTQEVMPYVMEWCTNNRCDIWKRNYNEKTCFKIGGAEICVGRPFIDLRLLDSLSCSAIVIVPHISRRGPNGLWILSRGAKHPLEQSFATWKAYYLAYGNSPCFIKERDGWKQAHSIELFSNRELAEKWQKEFDDDEDPSEIVSVEGSNLLILLSCLDIVEIDSCRYPITRDGLLFDETDEVATLEVLVSAFTNKTSGIAAAR